ncbi:MAG TPA: ribosome small subunit-dependent GTPase A [Polyangiaceae bacterium]|nr:ribosome small subunit-dependent GTPase A [Polyangiaceae bacterium]
MQLEAFGWDGALQVQLAQLQEAQQDPSLEPARVVAEHRGAYQVVKGDGPCWAEPTGRLRHHAQTRLDLPAVGDWVALDSALRVAGVLPRKSCFVRKVAAARTEPQVIAANIDLVFVVTSANADFNPRRIERYLSAISDSGASPVLVLNKTDLCEDVDALLATLGNAALGLPVARVSALERRGGEELARYLGPRVTIALVGSSGVGKSTIANWLLGKETLETSAIANDDRGRHTTTHRELLLLPGGGALIDTPGMRELTLWSDGNDASESFADISALAEGCRYVDCQHQGQPGCAIGEAVEAGELEPARVQSFFKLQRELAYQDVRQRQVLQQQSAQRGKQISRALRQRRRGPGGGKL